MMKGELTIVVPAFNEERRLAITVEEIVQSATRSLAEFEVIIINDGSRDGTADVAEQLSQKHKSVVVVHQPINQGVGAAYYRGLQLARFPYLTLVPGDNAFHQSGLDALFELVGKAEMVISYRFNPQARTPFRRLLSRCCTQAMRWLTGCSIQDAHSMYVFPVHQARQIRQNPGYGYHIETLSTLLRGNLGYLEVPVVLNPRPDASSKVMRLRVLAKLAWTMARLYFRFLIARKKVRFTPEPIAKSSNETLENAA
jgi:glycosyltransferase involved in cell wall biosynthesis